MTTTAGAGPGASHELGASFGSHVGGRGQVLGPLCTASPGVLAGSWMDSRTAGTQTGTLIWDTSVASGGFTCCATVQAPKI